MKQHLQQYSAIRKGWHLLLVLLMLFVAGCEIRDDDVCIYADEFGNVLEEAGEKRTRQVRVNAADEPIWISTGSESEKDVTGYVLVDSGVSVDAGMPLRIETSGKIELCRAGYGQHDERKDPIELFPDALDPNWQLGRVCAPGAEGTSLCPEQVGASGEFSSGFPIWRGQYFGVEIFDGGYSQWQNEYSCTLYGKALELVYVIQEGKSALEEVRKHRASIEKLKTQKEEEQAKLPDAPSNIDYDSANPADPAPQSATEIEVDRLEKQIATTQEAHRQIYLKALKSGYNKHQLWADFVAETRDQHQEFLSFYNEVRSYLQNHPPAFLEALTLNNLQSSSLRQSARTDVNKMATGIDHVNYQLIKTIEKQKADFADNNKIRQSLKNQIARLDPRNEDSYIGWQGPRNGLQNGVNRQEADLTTIANIKAGIEAWKRDGYKEKDIEKGSRLDDLIEYIGKRYPKIEDYFDDIIKLELDIKALQEQSDPDNQKIADKAQAILDRQKAINDTVADVQERVEHEKAAIAIYDAFAFLIRVPDELDKLITDLPLLQKFFTEHFIGFDDLTNLEGFEGLEVDTLDAWATHLAVNNFSELDFIFGRTVELTKTSTLFDEKIEYHADSYSPLNRYAFLNSYQGFKNLLEMFYALGGVLDQDDQAPGHAGDPSYPPYQLRKQGYSDHNLPYWNGASKLDGCWSDRGRGLLATVKPPENSQKYKNAGARDSRQGDKFETDGTKEVKEFFELYQYHIGSGLSGFGYQLFDEDDNVVINMPAKKTAHDGMLYFRYRDGITIDKNVPISDSDSKALFHKTLDRGWWGRNYANNRYTIINDEAIAGASGALEEAGEGGNVYDPDAGDGGMPLSVDQLARASLEEKQRNMRGYHVRVHQWKNCQAEDGQFLKAVILPENFTSKDLEGTKTREDVWDMEGQLKAELAKDYSAKVIDEYFRLYRDSLFSRKILPFETYIANELRQLGLSQDKIVAYIYKHRSALLDVNNQGDGELSSDLAAYGLNKQQRDNFFEENTKNRKLYLQNIDIDKKLRQAAHLLQENNIAVSLASVLDKPNSSAVIDLDACAIAALPAENSNACGVIGADGTYSNNCGKEDSTAQPVKEVVNSFGCVNSDGIYSGKAKVKGRVYLLLEDSYYPPQEDIIGVEGATSREEKWYSVRSYPEVRGVPYPFATGDGNYRGDDGSLADFSNKGSYEVVLETTATGLAIGNNTSSFIVEIIDVVREFLHGKKTASGYEGGFTADVYKTLTLDGEFIEMVRAILVLAIVIYSLVFVAGLAQVSRKEFLTLLMKLIFVSILLTDQSWTFFRDYLFMFFVEGVDELITIFTQHFRGIFAEVKKPVSGAVQGEVALVAGYQSAFGFLDETVMRFFTKETNYKILALFSTFPLGWIYGIMIYLGLYYFLYSVVRAVIVYVVSLIMVAILLMLAPLFIPMILFKLTESLFKNWWRQLLSFTLQPVVLFALLAIFNVFVYSSLFLLLTYDVCVQCVLGLQFSDIWDAFADQCVIYSYVPWGFNEQDPLAERLAKTPVTFMRVFMFYLMAHAMYKFTDWVVSIIGSLTLGSGGISAMGAADAAESEVSAAKDAVGAAAHNISDKLKYAVPKAAAKSTVKRKGPS